MELQTISNLNPVSFSKRSETLSIAQKKILLLLSNSIKDGKQVNVDDILDCYFECIGKDGKILIRGNFSTSAFFHQYVEKSHPTAKARAVSWFKTNLGSCIIKGRLLAIPIIDISDYE